MPNEFYYFKTDSNENYENNLDPKSGKLSINTIEKIGISAAIESLNATGSSKHGRAGLELNEVDKVLSEDFNRFILKILMNKYKEICEWIGKYVNGTDNSKIESAHFFKTEDDKQSYQGFFITVERKVEKKFMFFDKITFDVNMHIYNDVAIF